MILHVKTPKAWERLNFINRGGLLTQGFGYILNLCWPFLGVGSGGQDHSACNPKHLSIYNDLRPYNQGSAAQTCFQCNVLQIMLTVRNNAKCLLELRAVQ